MRNVVFIALLGLAGCAEPTETIYLARGEQRVQCGPYKAVNNVARAFAPESATPQVVEAEYKLRNCVSDYQRQGFNRVPN